MKMELPRGVPEANGVSSTRLLEFIQAVDREIDSLHGLVLVRHGHVVAEGYWKPYDAATPHHLWSLTKSFTAMAVGLAIAEGRFGLDDPILPFFPAEAPAEPSAHLQAMRVRHLLIMNTGHDTEPSPNNWDRSWQRAFFAHPVTHEPGTHFVYNTPASSILAALVEKTTGQPLAEYLKPRLLDPLGITDPEWLRDSAGTTFGGFGLSLRTGEIARFGQMLLQRGFWQGKPLVPGSWVAAATSRQTANGDDPANDWAQGYGYQFWMSRHGYRADGAFGQFCFVFPDRDAVLAVTAGTPDTAKFMALVWEKLLPALTPSAQPPDPAGQDTLARALTRLSLPPVASTDRPAATRTGMTFVFPDNPRKIETLRLELGSDGVVALAVRADGKASRVPCGDGVWLRGSAPWWNIREGLLAASGGWTAPDTFTAKFCQLEGSFVHTVSLVFSGQEILLTDEANVAFGPTRLPDLRGVAAAG